MVDGDLAEDGREHRWIDTVGAFGVASAGYWWGREGACLVRAAHYLVGPEHALWALLYADDGNLLDGTDTAPISVVGRWRKVRGSLSCDFVRLHVDSGRFLVGISESRACWVADWIDKVVEEGAVLMREFNEALGRLGFPAGPLRWMRPFLGPLHAWVAACPGGSFRRIPAKIRVLLARISLHIKAAGCPAAGSFGPSHVESSSASTHLVLLGSWSLEFGEDPLQARWFSLQLTQEDVPYLFDRKP